MKTGRWRAMGRRCGLLLVVAASPCVAQVPRPPRVDVYEAGIPELQAAMRRGAVTSVELVDAYIARIRAFDQQGPALNAIIRLNPDARAEAAALDAERAGGHVRGPLHGIPVILKDNYDTKGLATSAGSLALASNVPSDDAFIVQRLRAAGAVILGKANMHELAAGITTISSLGGQTRNPYDPRRCPGGSSGGTGAAVAASFAAVGWGSDTCGSIRIPAAFNSLFGLRPTEGLVSRTGIVPLSHTQDVGGPLARTMTDLAIALDATIGPDPRDSVTRVLAGRALPDFADSLRADALRGRRLGVLRNEFTGTDRDVERVLDAALERMKAQGAELVDVTIPDLDSVLAGSRAIDLETKFDLQRYLAGHPEAPVHTLGEILAGGLYSTALDTRLRHDDSVGTEDSEAHRAVLAKQVVVRERLTRVLDSLGLDALIYPTERQKPAFIGEPQTGSTCQLSAQSGLPALTAPAGFTADGLPVGIELLGRAFADGRLVALAYAFEQAGPARRAPSTTPPLDHGHAPVPVAFDVRATPLHPGDAASVAGRFVWDGTAQHLSYDVRVTGAAADRVLAVVLQRADSSGSGPVVYRLVPPVATAAAGTIALDGGEAALLTAGRLTLDLYTMDRPLGAARGTLVVPR
jgi:amidase